MKVTIPLSALLGLSGAMGFICCIEVAFMGFLDGYSHSDYPRFYPFCLITGTLSALACLALIAVIICTAVKYKLNIGLLKHMVASFAVTIASFFVGCFTIAYIIEYIRDIF